MSSVYGQERIYLVTRNGGSLNGGTILSFDPQGSDVKVNLNFGQHFFAPRHVNIKGPDGFLYGIAYGGNVTGGIFKIQPEGTGYEQIFDLGGDGASDGGMAISDEGIIYGSTFSGGSFGSGVIYSINHDGTEYKKLHEFTWGLSMTNFPATVVVGSDDMLYGTNHLGSTSYGCIYAVAKDGTGFKEVLNFNSVGMQSPAGLFQGQDGRLYGLSRGSSSSAPQLYRVNTDGSGFESIHTFSSDEGPGYSIYQGTNERIYGTLTKDDGSIFSCEPDGSDYKILHIFNMAEGANPSGGIYQAPDGFIYGRTTTGADNGLGTVFRLQADGSNFEILTHSFLGSPSSRPYVDDEGTVYGFTSDGGEYSNGTLFKVAADSEEILYSFGAPNLAAYYTNEGVTEVDDNFVMFAMPRNLTSPLEITIVGITPENTLITHSLPVVTNSSGISRPVKGPDGFLYSTTQFGGANLQGLLFRTKADGSLYSAVHNFSQATGMAPYGEILVGLDGRLYGTCFQGGNANSGVIYAVNNDGSNYTVLHHFSFPTGQIPLAGLIQGSDGTIYGCAKNVFSINSDGTNYQQLHAFQNTETTGGELSLVGNYLYGALTTGGVENKGALFRIKTDGSDYSIVHNFNGLDGERPYAGIFPYAGSLFGATSLGGAFGFGTIYKLNALGQEFTKIIDLTHFTGGQPSGDLTGKCVPASKPVISIVNGVLTSTASVGNQWYRNGIVIPGANDISYEASSSGIYTVASNLQGCPGGMSDGQLINITSLENEKRESTFSFYPNPTNKYLFISLSVSK